MSRKNPPRKKSKAEKELESKLLTPEERIYAKLRSIGLSKPEAYKIAFDDDSPRSELSLKADSLESRQEILSELQRLKDHLKHEILKEAPNAFKRLVELSRFAKSEKVRLDANRDILDRAGFSEPVKLQSFAIFSFFTPEQLKEILRVHMLQGVARLRDGKKE